MRFCFLPSRPASQLLIEFFASLALLVSFNPLPLTLIVHPPLTLALLHSPSHPFDYSRCSITNSAYLPRSSNQSALLALSLLRLLSQNRIAEFHTLLETLESEIKESKEVGWVLTVSRRHLLSCSRLTRG